MSYKKGDIVSSAYGAWVMIIKDRIMNGHARVFAICDTDTLYVGEYYGWYDRLATEEEKNRLFKFLLKKGYSWDEENLQLIQEL